VELTTAIGDMETAFTDAASRDTTVTPPEHYCDTIVTQL
jgi:hypothetical protein